MPQVYMYIHIDIPMQFRCLFCMLAFSVGEHIGLSTEFGVPYMCVAASTVFSLHLQS